jgi:hypothetical protein
VAHEDNADLDDDDEDVTDPELPAKEGLEREAAARCDNEPAQPRPAVNAFSPAGRTLPTKPNAPRACMHHLPDSELRREDPVRDRTKPGFSVR